MKKKKTEKLPYTHYVELVAPKAKPKSGARSQVCCALISKTFLAEKNVKYKKTNWIIFGYMIFPSNYFIPLLISGRLLRISELKK